MYKYKIFINKFFQDTIYVLLNDCLIVTTRFKRYGSGLDTGSDTLSFCQKNLQLTKTMISVSIIFSCFLLGVSAILEEKHLIFDDPVHGPHDRLSSANPISAS